MSDPLHPILLRQLSLAGADPDEPPSPELWRQLLSVLSSHEHQRDLREAPGSPTRETPDAMPVTESKDAFVAMMSHELRTPLNAIIGYSDMVIHSLPPSDPNADDVHRIRSAGHHLLALINGILDLTRIESGELELFVEQTDVTSLLEDCVDMMAPQCQGRGNRMDLDLDPSLGILEVDAMRVQHCVLHVLSNAVKFTTDGEILIRAYPSPRDELCIEVHDTGIGMLPEQVDRIFAAFQRGSPEVAREYGGMGLGLTLTRRLLTLMRGRIDVSSTPGHGSTFTLLIPTGQAALEDEATLTLIPELSDSRGLVLVVDDDPAIQQLIRRYLESEGYDTVLCGRPQQALALARTLSPRAITLDVLMPEVDGWQVLTELRADSETRDIPVIMVSMVEDRAKGLRLGASEYLTKPVSKVALLEALDDLGERHEEYVLIVDDDESLQQLAAHLVSVRGLKPVTVSNGREALSWLSTCDVLPRLIMLDLVMPEMDGHGLLQVLDHHAEWSSIPTLILTAKELTVRERTHLELTTTRVVAKQNSRARDLMAELDHALRNSSTTPGIC